MLKDAFLRLCNRVCVLPSVQPSVRHTLEPHEYTTMPWERLFRICVQIARMHPIKLARIT